MTTKELFESRVNKHWDDLKGRDDTIFENITVFPNTNTEFDKFKKSSFYMPVLQENSTYEKKKILETYFWSEIIGDLYENTVGIMEKAGILEESTGSFENAYKIETTARLILENGVFADFPQRKELAESFINELFYPDLIEEGFFQGTEDKVSTLVKSAKTAWALAQVLFFLMVSSGPAAISNSRIKQDIAGDKQSPQERKYVKTLSRLLAGTIVVGGAGLAAIAGGPAGAAIGGVGLSAMLGMPGLLWKFFNKDLVDLTKYLQKINTMGDEDVRSVLREMGARPGEMVLKCWKRHNHQFSGQDVESKNLWESLIKSFTSEGNSVQNFLRNPLFADSTQMSVALKKDASDPKYQKMFFDFRTCLYEKVFEIIIGYAQAIYSVDDASYEIIRYANDVHKRKNFKAFFALDPKSDSEVAMFKLIKLLISIEDMVIGLKTNKMDLVGDKYIDQFILMMEQHIKQTYQTLDELAEQRSYNKARYDEMNPTDEERAEAIQQERSDAKQSIFS